jgi:hypothetical protein
MMMTENRVALYVLAGVATSLNFMEEFVQRLKVCYVEVGFEVQLHMLFPYGDWNRSLVKQLFEIGHDLMPKLRRNSSYLIRGQKVADYIMTSYNGSQIVIVGHSSGGVAGVHAANILDLAQIPIASVVQIGSPKCPISRKHQSSTLFISAVNHNGKSSDPITRLGSWGGWERSGRIVRWNSKLAAPDHRITVRLVGGHADYFRNHSSFVDGNGLTNLDKTSGVIWEWLQPK